MNRDLLIVMIRQAFPQAELDFVEVGSCDAASPDRFSAILDELPLLPSDDVPRVLPKILIEILQSETADGAGIALDVLSFLDVGCTYPEGDVAHYEEIAKARSQDDAEYVRGSDCIIREAREQSFSHFSVEQARALVAFLATIGDWPQVRFAAENTWLSAMDYWTKRSAG